MEVKNLKLQGKDLLIVILVLLLGGAGWFYVNNNQKWDKKYSTELKLREALLDSMVISKNKHGELVAEKRTLQGELSDLTSDNVKLNDDQKELLGRVKTLQKEKTVISAALVRQGVRIGELENIIASATEIDTINNTISFIENDTTKDFQYDLMVSHVKPINLETPPTLRFNNIYFPNTQIVTFSFDKNERKDYPISFSVSNSNPYYQTYNIESYAIKGLSQENVNPTGWQKFGKFFTQYGKYMLVGVGGVALGVLASP